MGWDWVGRPGLLVPPSHHITPCTGPLGAACPAGTLCRLRSLGTRALLAGTGREAAVRGERQVNLPLELPSANNKTMPGRGPPA